MKAAPTKTTLSTPKIVATVSKTKNLKRLPSELIEMNQSDDFSVDDGYYAPSHGKLKNKSTFNVQSITEFMIIANLFCR